jgi:hypothetical protein
MSAELDRDAMRKVCGGKSGFLGQFVSPFIGGFQPQPLSGLFADPYGDLTKKRGVVSSAHSAIFTMARNVKG